MPENPQERRRSTRRELSDRERCPIEYKIVGGGFFQKAEVALTRNISASGLLFLSSTMYPLNIVLKARLTLPGGHKPISIKGKIVRSEPTENPKRYSIAITFTEINEHDREEIDKFCSALKSDKTQLPPDKDYQVYI